MAWDKLFPQAQTPNPLSPSAPVPSVPDLDLRKEFDELVRRRALLPSLTGEGASSLSQLTIDTDKDWEGFSISNLNDLQILGRLIVLGTLRVPIDVEGVAVGDIRYNSSSEQLELWTGLEWEPIGESSGDFDEAAHEILPSLVHNIAQDSITDFVYSDGQLSEAVVWKSVARTEKIKESLFSYTGPDLTEAIIKQYDAAGIVVKYTLTKTFSYLGGELVSITVTRT